MRAGGDNSAPSVTARERTQLCSFRTFGLCSPHLKPKVAELIAWQPAARCSVRLPGKGCVPQLMAMRMLLKCPRVSPYSRTHKLSPSPGFYHPCLSGCGGDCRWGVSLPLVLLAGDLLLSCLARCRLSLAGALPPARSRAPFPFRANAGRPLLLARLQHISQLTLFIYLILFFFLASSFVSGG